MGRIRKVLREAGRKAGLWTTSDDLRGQLTLVRERMGQLDDRLEELERRLDAVTGSVDTPGAFPATGADAGAAVAFHADMTIAAIRAAHPHAAAVLQRHHLGGCSACSVAEVETLRQGTQLHRVDLDAVIRDLAALSRAQGS
jgi:hybrid cluster-associated redox disulfide protein